MSAAVDLDIEFEPNGVSELWNTILPLRLEKKKFLA